MPEMLVALAVTGDDHVAEVRALLSKLRADDDVPGLAPRLVRGAADPQDLGLVDEVIQVALDPTLHAGVAGVVTTWLTTRKRAVKLRIKREGKELDLDAGNPKDAARILEQVKAFLDED